MSVYIRLRDEIPKSPLAILQLSLLAAMGKKEKIRLSIMKRTPKVRQKTFGVHFIVVAAVVFLLLYLLSIRRNGGLVISEGCMARLLLRGWCSVRGR